MDQKLPEISRMWMAPSREGSPSRKRTDNAIFQLARELQQTQKISENSLLEVHREIERIADHRHKTDRSIERLANRIEALELRCENRVRSIEDAMERIVARLEVSLEKTVDHFRSRSADESARIQSWLSSAVTTFTTQIDDCRDRQERDRCAFAEELLGLQEATNERHRALRTIIERQGEAHIAFEKGFRTFLARYQEEIEDVLLTLQENTVEKHRLVETRIDVQNSELFQLKLTLEAQIESVSKQDRRRGEALQTGFNSNLESLKETMLTRSDVGRIMDWLRQDLIATITDRQFADSIQDVLQRSKPQNEDRRPEDTESKSHAYSSEMKAATSEKEVAGGDDGYADEEYEDADLDEHWNNPQYGDDNHKQENFEGVKDDVNTELDVASTTSPREAQGTLQATPAVKPDNEGHLINPDASSSAAKGDSRLASSSEGKSEYESSFEDERDVEHPLPEIVEAVHEPDPLPDHPRNSMDDAF